MSGNFERSLRQVPGAAAAAAVGMSEITWLTATMESDSNPFVGPRPIVRGEALYGRDAEIDELYDRLLARRIVVLHSPSGAGKSSLVQAGLVPRLRHGSYDVWKPIRVNLDPDGLLGVPEGANRYLLSALVSLEEELPAKHRRTPAQLAALSLDEYVRTRPRRKRMKGREVVLLFDQFEEVLTVDPRAVEAKQAFFAAVGQALEHETIWALFIIREDYLAALAPYRDQIPTHLANTFRLGLLGLEGAREAAEYLALSKGRRFPAVDDLILDLSTVQVQQPDGRLVREQGRHVEPVQLQVVCRRLWGAMPPNARSIDKEHIERFADVSRSLAGYYADAVRTIAGSSTALERVIRDWMGRELIVGGHRSQVRQDGGTVATLGWPILGKLFDAYLLRSEQRAGAHWIELSHDRLVEPILEDNKAWEQAHLHPLQVQAKLWDHGGRARALLLGADALPSALDWAQEHPAQVTGTEQQFLAQSQAMRQGQARHRRRMLVFMVVLGIFAIVAMGMGGVAWVMQGRAQSQQQQAESAQKEAEQAKDIAVAAQRNAEQAKDEAVQAKEQAERVQQANERLVRSVLRQMFEVALLPFIQRLGEEGSGSGVLEVGKHWTTLLASEERVFAAATVVDTGGRIVAFAQVDVLPRDERGESSVAAVTLHWLLGDQARRGVAIVSHRPRANARLRAMERGLEQLEYEHVYNPSLDDLEGLSRVGVLIIDNRWQAFTEKEVATVEKFVRRGGGVLALGEGSAWLSRERGEGESPVTLDDYPMNRLLRAFDLRWTEQTIEPRALATLGKTARVQFENRRGSTIALYARNDEGDDEHYADLGAGEHLEVTTTFGQQWIVRATSERTVIAEDVIEQDGQRIVIRKRSAPRARASKSRTPASKAESTVESTAESKADANAPSDPGAELTMVQRPSAADLAPAKRVAQRAARACGKLHGALMPDVELKIVIQPDGSATDVRALAPMKETPVGTCVVQKVLMLKFPESQQGTTATWTLDLL